MTLPVEVNPLLMGGGGYRIAKSLRFRSSASAYLSRTPGSAGNRKTWTWSCWLKRGTFADYNVFDTRSAVAGVPRGGITFNSSNAILVQFNPTGSSWDVSITTSAVYRDPSAWYHLIVAVDTTQATASDRLKIYLNGAQATASGTYPATQNMDLPINAAVDHRIGSDGVATSAYMFDGYLAEVNFIDGQALTPSSFGETDPVTGVWKPKKYTGAYGTNGFYLPFNDATSTTTIGYDRQLGLSDSSKNNWTANNISVTSGVTYDSMIDTPTLYADGGNGRGNYCVLNPLKSSTNLMPFDGNLNVVSGIALGYASSVGTIGMASGKWYWEVTVTDTAVGADIGIATAAFTDLDNDASTSPYAWVYYYSGTKYHNNVSASYGASYTVNDVIGVALDLDNGTLVFYKNGTSQGTAYSSLPADTYFALVADDQYGSSSAPGFAVNFGQRPFAYTPPSGFKALNTQNLPDPTIKAGNKYFDVVTRNGFGTSGGSITSLAFQPDFFWEKQRNGVSNHYLIDAVRGVSKYLNSDATVAEGTAATYLTSFNSNGYTMGAGDFTSGQTMVDWLWKANGSGSSNTSGTITSTVSANPTAGFSVVSFVNPSGTTQGTVGHGLNAAPQLIIAKDRVTTGNLWVVFHASVCDTTSKYLSLSGTGAVATFSTIWGANLPTSSVFGVTAGGIGTASVDMIAYCFAAVSGYSAFGSYIGNGSTDGPFVYLGFKPRFIMFKRTDSTSQWVIKDTSRSPYNVMNESLYPNLSQAEDSGDEIDILSNGFKCRPNITGTTTNSSGGTYIYAAFAENPFKYALAR